MAKFGRADIRKIIGEACTEEIENQLIALHMGVVDPLKDALDSAKAESAKVSDLQKKLEEATAEKGKFEDMKAKYEKEHSEFEAFKTRTESEKALETVKGLYRALLKESKVEIIIPAVMSTQKQEYTMIYLQLKLLNPSN
jgi:predicted transcriptional regulator